MVRHAQSTWNAEGRWQGQADPPLSDLGLSQAARAAERLVEWPRFELVVSSDLQRARRTAEILARAIGISRPVIVETGLREYDVAAWSGLTREEISARWPVELDRFLGGQLSSPPGGEDRDDFDRRICDAVARVAGLAAGGSVERVLVVTHGGVIRSLARSHEVAEYRAGQLSGYHCDLTAVTIAPRIPVDLLGPGAVHPGSRRAPDDADPVAL